MYKVEHDRGGHTAKVKSTANWFIYILRAQCEKKKVLTDRCDFSIY